MEHARYFERKKKYLEKKNNRVLVALREPRPPNLVKLTILRESNLLHNLYFQCIIFDDFFFFGNSVEFIHIMQHSIM